MRVDFVSVVVVVSLCWYEENFYAIATDVCGDVYESDQLLTFLLFLAQYVVVLPSSHPGMYYLVRPRSDTNFGTK